MRTTCNMRQGLIALILAVAMIQEAWAAGVEISGNVSVSGTLSAIAVTGDGSGLTNISGAALSNASVTQDKLAGATVGSTQLANDAVTPAKLSFYGRVAIVAKSGGDYNDPATAMTNFASWCSSPLDNPCLLKIMPGVYEIGTGTVQMKPYIDIEGSGENTTIIKGTLSHPYLGVVVGANKTELRFLTVQNVGGGANAIAVSNISVSSKMINVTATATGGTDFSYGVYNSGSAPEMINVTASGTGGNQGYGVHNYETSPTMTNVAATGTGGSESYGVYNFSSSPTMINVTATGTGGSESYGVYNRFSNPTMINVRAFGTGGANSRGVYNFEASPAMTNVMASGTGGSESCGVYNYSSSPIMQGMIISAKNGSNHSRGIYNSGTGSAPLIRDTLVQADGGSIGTYADGIYNDETSNPELVGISVQASNAQNNFAISNNGAGLTVRVDHSVLKADTAIINGSSTIRIGHTRMEGTINNIGGTITCLDVYDGNYNPITCQ